MLIEKYTSNWVQYFKDIKGEIAKGLHGIAYTIQHVGSTAVPNLDAKPIIDIDIVYTEPIDFASIKAGLAALGYFHNGNQGIEEREVFKRNGTYFNEILDRITHHLYVCPAHSKALERHMLSRDFLRKNDWARLQYQQMKYELAEKSHQDRKRYAALKELEVNGFIDSIIAKEKNQGSSTS
ncbi:GrpB family protein [Pedobacter xixiisoli]|uniref:GrpB domain, predicted nucleotidyltransferase, UPF0157 family n=1 Tax=Pedobacter xixiisoli TaxID=1476464 RepID=A0A285ZZP4_9SPHI|nr:GrpB family protein [Pedobacter xixiisoli]SOD15110.1 GrpB domain, predicted nucleotidyltransferase, UPF0157 family [Pedobacter xixiisoli]